MAQPETLDLIPKFGLRQAGDPYIPRPTVFGLALDDKGRLAIVRIARETRVSWDLPGGMIDPGETEPQALVREFCEETGWRVAPGALVTRAEQLTITRTGERRLNQCAFYLCRLIEMTDGKIEDDHDLVWLDAHEALARLRHEAAAWAVTSWLRLGSSCPI